MSVKWTVKDAIQALAELKNPFDKMGIGANANKPKLSEIISSMAGNNGEKETANTIPRR